MAGNPNPQHNPTDGLGVAAFVHVSGTGVTANETVASNKPNPGNYKLTLSIGGTDTCQLTASAVDVSNAAYTRQSIVLTAAANAASGKTVYTGTIPASGALVGQNVTVAGFATGANNGTFKVVAVAADRTTITLNNAAGAAETHAGTITPAFTYVSYNNPSAGSPAWYNPSNFGSYTPDVASVSSTGLITGLAAGQAIIEVSFPTFDNNLGGDAQGEGEPNNFIYTQIVVTVTP